MKLEEREIEIIKKRLHHYAVNCAGSPLIVTPFQAKVYKENGITENYIVSKLLP